MTGHRPADRERAFRDFRVALAPLEASGKLRGVLVQYHPRFVKSAEALEVLDSVEDLLAPLVPLAPPEPLTPPEPDVPLGPPVPLAPPEPEVPLAPPAARSGFGGA